MPAAASRRRVSSAFSTSAKTGRCTSLPVAFSCSNWPTLPCCRWSARTWRRAGATSASLLMAGLIVMPQILVALLSPWVGYYSEKWGRKPLLLVGFALEIVRAALFAFSTDYTVLIVGQLLGGISAAAVTVVTVLVITDLTTGTGRFNLVRGSIGTVIAVAASVSTTASWVYFSDVWPLGGFLSLAAIALSPRRFCGSPCRRRDPGNISIERVYVAAFRRNQSSWCFSNGFGFGSCSVQGSHVIGTCCPCRAPVVLMHRRTHVGQDKRPFIRRRSRPRYVIGRILLGTPDIALN